MKQKNILIEYTKWIIKWLFGISLFTSLIFGGFYYYNDYQNQLVPIISLKCKTTVLFYKLVSDREYDQFFMIQKRKKAKIPKGIYRSPHLFSSKVTKNTKVTDLVEIEPFYESYDDFYVFKERYNNEHNNFRFELNRKDLTMRIMKSSPSRDEDKIFMKWECEQITTEEFYMSEQIKLKSLKQEFKF